MTGRKADWQRRYQRLQGPDLCGACGFCNGRACEPYRVELRNYTGIRFTADGFDCALPVTIDSHSVCAYGCLYCFSEQLFGHTDNKMKPVGQTNLGSVERIFAGEGGDNAALVRKALKYDRRNAQGYPCPVQLGGINDPFDELERQQGWALEFMKLAIKYRQPVRISTKGVVIAEPEYLAMLARAPELFWVAWSINTIDDDMARITDARAPSPSRRLAAMRKVAALGCKTSLRMRPLLPGLSDSTRRHPRAYAELVEKAAEAGAYAISYEVGFVPTGMSKEHKTKWEKLERTIGVDLHNVYSKLGKHQACLRPSYLWTEQLMHSIHEVASRCGLSIGVSDPIWKQLTTTGCCCGMRPDDPVFGNWQREQATNAMFEAARDPSRAITWQDCVPPWSAEMLAGNMIYFGPGPKVAYMKKHITWKDKLMEQWDNAASERGPLFYFQGAWRVAGRDAEGHLTYRYVGLQRRHPVRTPYWIVEAGNGKEKAGEPRHGEAEAKAPKEVARRRGRCVRRTEDAVGQGSG